MAARIIDGKAIAATIRAELADEVAAFKAETGITPGLTAVLLGEDPGSQIYVRNKKKAGDAIGINADVRHFPQGMSEADLLKLVAELNADDSVHGILVQLPLTEGIDEQRVLDAIDPDKDVDGFHPVNAGRLMSGLPGTRPCTPTGILELLDRSDIALEGKKAVVVGRSNIVGKPVALMLLERHATVTICHSRTQHLADEVRQADVVVAAVGKPKLIQGGWLKPGCAVIDVGTNRTPEGKLVGDVDFEAAKDVAAAITPVPGGVGPMTIAMLMKNTLFLARRHS